MLDTSRELYDYFTSGKKNKDGNSLKTIKEDEKAKNEVRPPWRSTGVSNVPSWNKPSKYQLNSNIKAKVFTGLTSDNKNHPKSLKDLQATENNGAEENQKESPSQSDGEFTIDENGDIMIQSDERNEEQNRTLYQHMLLKCINGERK